MKTGGRMAAAIEILADIETRHRPAAAALKDWGVSHRFAGSGDRAAIGNIVYDALRWRASSAWIMGEESPRAVVLATVARRWRLGADGIARAVAGDSHAPEAPSTEEAARLGDADLDAAPAHVRADVPEWLAPRLEEALGADWVAEGEALAQRPPLDLRVNALKADRDRAGKALARFGAAATQHSPVGLRIPPTTESGRHPNVQVEPGFRKGWFEVQDEGSQIAAQAVAAKPGEQVLDLAAGAGGKTLALAAAMANTGQVHATDGDRGRLAPIFERLKRAGTRNVQVHEAGAELEELAGKMDAVLVDAPCTGTGVWRRHPDAKWRLRERAIGERAAEQDRLLAGAANYVKPGGRLVYVTCSLLPEENDRRVAAFLAAHAAFQAVPPADVVARAGLDAGLANAALTSDRGLLLTPHRTGTDGFFVAVMARG